MNNQLHRLFQIAQKKQRFIIGLMSGTSLDGLDIALCKVSGQGTNTSLLLEKFVTIPYDDKFRNAIRSVFAQKNVDLEFLTQINSIIGNQHALLINQALANWQIDADQIDVIASHGQTIYHAPQRLSGNYDLPNSTLQLGDADHIAVKTGITTISDFRQKHIAAGGEGAPLAAYGDYLLFTSPTENRFLLNIGGIANYTFLPNNDSSQKAFATDIGPGNTIMNQYMFAYFGLEMDLNAQIASKGTINEHLLKELMNNSFFAEPFPKTTGPELFSLQYLEEAQQKSNTLHLSKENVVATLCAFSAKTIAHAIEKQAAGLDNVHIYVSGGGLHNPLLMHMIREYLSDYPVLSFQTIGIDPDAKEACLFALLANETLVGEPENVNAILDSPAVCMGKISLPK